MKAGSNHLSKKKWTKPLLFSFRSEFIKSGGGSVRFEQINLINTGGTCGTTGVIIGTQTGGTQSALVCRQTPSVSPCNPGFFNVSAKGTLGTGSANFALCS